MRSKVVSSRVCQRKESVSYAQGIAREREKERESTAFIALAAAAVEHRQFVVDDLAASLSLVSLSVTLEPR